MSGGTVGSEASKGGSRAALEALRAVTRGARLTRLEAREAFEAVVLGEAPASVSAALLGAMAARGETADEVAGVVDVLLARCTPLPIEAELAAACVDVCGTGGDALGTFNISTATAFAVAGAGAPVAKHGGRAVSSSSGSADVLAALGVNIEMPAARAAEALRRAAVTFLFAPAYHPAMRNVAPLRRELGVRTIFNLAGPLSNPAGVRRQIVGVDRPERVEVIAKALALRGSRALVFSNEAGGDELLPLGKTRLAEVRDGDLWITTVATAAFGLREGDAGALAGGSPERNAEILRGLLSGATGTARDTVLMNAAAALRVSGRVESLRDGVDLARESLERGAAREALASLVALSREETA